MTDRFVIFDRRAANLKGSRLFVHGAGPRTFRTRLVIAEEFPLCLQNVFKGSPNDSLSDIDGQGFDGIEVDVEPGPFVTVRAAGGDFSPSVGHVAKLGRFVGLSLGEWHGVFLLELGAREKLGSSY
jgi:hypothetical protein